MASTSWNGTSPAALAVRSLWTAASLMLVLFVITPDQFTRRNPCSQCTQVAFKRAVFIDERRFRSHALHEFAQRRGDGCRIVDAQTQARSLHRSERMCRSDLLGQLQNPQAITRGDG